MSRRPWAKARQGDARVDRVGSTAGERTYMNPSRYRKRLRLAAIVLALVAPAAQAAAAPTHSAADRLPVTSRASWSARRTSRVEDHRRDLRAGVGGQRLQRGAAVRHRQPGDLRSRRAGPLDRPGAGYTGNLLQYFDPKTTVTTPDAVELALARALPGDLSILTPSPANDTDTVAVTEATARKWNLKTIGDLAAHWRR